MVDKRPHPDDLSPDFAANSTKRPRSINASPASAKPSDGAPKPDIAAQIAAAKARAEEIKRRLAAQSAGSGSASPAAGAPSASTAAAAGKGPAPSATDAASAAAAAVRERLEAVKARIAETRANAAAAAAASSPTTASPSTALPPSRPAAQTSSFNRQPPPPSLSDPQLDDSNLKARGGLGVGLHPALLAEPTFDKSKSHSSGLVGPKFATTAANQRIQKQPKKIQQLDLSAPSLEELRKNPYFDPSLGGGKAAIARPRQSKPLVLNSKGKYIAQANALRHQARLEEIKRKIVDQQRRVRLEESNNRVFAVPEPPKIEWWDEGLVVGDDYSALDRDDESGLRLEGEDSVITIYIQHPVPIEPPQDKLVQEPKPMYLTQKEQAKIRRQTRKLDMKEEQAKIRLGLKPAPPPKANKSNMMRVYPEEAVRDPTALEMRVSREIADRAENHKRANEERKLTDEQRRQKLVDQQAKDAAKGIRVCVFRIETLCFGRHRYQIDINAKQNALTGVVVMSPAFCVVIVEGGAHSIRNFKKLMLNRVRWTENEAPPSTEEMSASASGPGSTLAAVSGAKRSNPDGGSDLPDWLRSVDGETGQVKDIRHNRCTLVWEGEELGRAFRKWMGSKTCETEYEAKDVLSRWRMDNFWTLAQGMGLGSGDGGGGV